MKINKDYLRRGDLMALAKAHGFDYNYLRQVSNGTRTNDIMAQAINAFNEVRKDEFRKAQAVIDGLVSSTLTEAAVDIYPHNIPAL